MMHPPLTLTALTKHYGKSTVLGGISLAVAPRQIFGLIGLNGVGKTTLIKIVLGLLQEDGGEALLFGESKRQASARRHLFYLPEKFMPSGMLKGHEYLALSCAFHGQKYQPQAGEAWAQKLDLKPEALRQRISRYSKGMGQKLGLISAFLSAAPLLILDEPMSGLDPKARAFLKRALKEYRDAGHSIFFSSHILADMEEICDTVAVLHEGSLLYTGTPAALKQRQHAEGKSLEDTFLQLLEA